MDIVNLIKSIVPITLFNKGKASQLFSKVNHNETLVVVKNNTPVAIITSPKEYELLRQLSNACKKNLEKSFTEEQRDTIKKLTLEIESFDENRGLV